MIVIRDRMFNKGREVVLEVHGGRFTKNMIKAFAVHLNVNFLTCSYSKIYCKLSFSCHRWKSIKGE